MALVGADNKITFRSIKVGPRVDAMWIVEDGVAVGDRIVVEGLQRIREGLTVAPKPAPPAAEGNGMARFFVERPIVAIVLSIITVLLGAVAMQGLPIAQCPEDRAADGAGHHLHRRQRARTSRPRSRRRSNRRSTASRT